MNKADLSILVKSTIEVLDACLEAAEIPKDLAKFDDKQVKRVQALFEIRKKDNLKTFPEAVTLYQQQQAAAASGPIAIATPNGSPAKTAFPTFVEEGIALHVSAESAEDMRGLAKVSEQEMTEQFLLGTATRILAQNPQAAFEQGQQFGESLLTQARQE
ncbi:MAG: hypothetical protein WCD18_01235, partial [Thermosynechococcaceae cyanobacterium]